MKSFINDGIINVPSNGACTGEDYGQKGISQGDDWGVPSHGTPDPGASVCQFTAIKGMSGGSNTSPGKPVNFDKSGFSAKL